VSVVPYQDARSAQPRWVRCEQYIPVLDELTLQLAIKWRGLTSASSEPQKKDLAHKSTMKLFQNLPGRYGKLRSGRGREPGKAADAEFGVGKIGLDHCQGKLTSAQRLAVCLICLANHVLSRVCPFAVRLGRNNSQSGTAAKQRANVQNQPQKTRTRSAQSSGARFVGRTFWKTRFH
jgi:hypothetical protein